MKSIRTYILWVELIFVVIVVAAIVFSSYRTSKVVTAQIVNEQNERVVEIVKLLQERATINFHLFQQFAHLKDPSMGVPFMVQFHELYELDSNYRVTNIFKKEPTSVIFIGYDFRESGVRSYMESAVNDSVTATPLLQSPEANGVSTYVFHRLGNSIRVGVIRLNQTTAVVNEIAASQKVIIAIISPTGYLLSCSVNKLSSSFFSSSNRFAKWQGTEYLVLKKPMDALGNQIYVLTPRTRITSVTEVWFRAIVFLLFFLLLFVFLKTWIVDSLVSRPLKRVAYAIETWESNTEGKLYLADLLHVSEIRKITEEFAKKNRQVGKYIQELSGINKELERIIFVASHDLRSPLVNINGFAAEIEMALKKSLAEEGKPESTGEIFQALSIIQKNAQRMDQLLRVLQLLSRISRTPFNFTQVAMNSLAVAVFGKWQKSADFDFQLGAVPDCKADESRLIQLLDILIENSLKFARPGVKCQISFSGSRQGKWVEYLFCDNGMGISEKYVEKVFELYHRLYPNQSEGLGVGLTIARQIVTRHGGAISVQPNVEFGCTFSFTLPSVG